MIRKCDKCQDEKPCIQRRDGSWACGPCLQEEWISTKTKMVNTADALVRSIRTRHAKRSVNA